MKPAHLNHTRRERQIMDIVYRKGQASVADVLAALPDPPSYSAVRAMMNLLKDKGQLKHREVGRKYIYYPALPRDKACRTVCRHLFCAACFTRALEVEVRALRAPSPAPASSSVIEIQRGAPLPAPAPCHAWPLPAMQAHGLPLHHGCRHGQCAHATTRSEHHFRVHVCAGADRF